MGLDTGVTKPLAKALATRVNGTPPPEIPLADIHLDSLEFWALDDDVRDATFATLRREAPISFWEPIQYEGFETGSGYWALTKLDDIHFASRHPEIFSSAGGITINDQTPDLAEYFGSMIVLDDPRHHGCAPSSAGRSPLECWPASRRRCANAPTGWSRR